MARRSRIAATLTIAGNAPLLAAAAANKGAAAAALTLPTTTIPSTTLPTVTAPTITTPTVSTPVVSTPTTSTPKVTTPTTSTPTVSTPKLTTSKTTTPSYTAPSTTSVGSTVQRTGQALTGGSSGSGGITGAGGSAPSIPGIPSAIVGTGGNSGSTTKSAGGVGQGLSTGSNGTIAPVYGGGPGTGGPGAFGGPGGPGNPGQGAGGLGGLGSSTSMLLLGGADVLQLRSALAPLLGCFYAISPFQQELLVMGAGLDGRTPISRTRLASAFGVTPRKVARTERMALRQMRAAALEDGCMVGATASGLAVASAFIDGPFGPPGFVNPATGPVGRPGVVALAAAGLPSSAVGSRAITDQLASLGKGGEPGPIWMILLITALLFLSFGVLLREARRSV